MARTINAREKDKMKCVKPMKQVTPYEAKAIEIFLAKCRQDAIFLRAFFKIFSGSFHGQATHAQTDVSSDICPSIMSYFVKLVS